MVAAAMLCLAVSGTTLAARGGNTAAAKACQRGGWTVLQTSSGGTFANQDECVEYGTTGRSLYKPSFTFDPTTVTEGVLSELHVTGFHPNSNGDLTSHLLGGSGSTFSFLDVPLDANGNMAVIGTVFNSPSCTNGVYGADWSFVDDFGVHAEATTYLDCP